jgi:serine/threonine-protein kinase HipA
LKNDLQVYREFEDDYQLVGTLLREDEGAIFCYDPSYLQRNAASSISLALPLQSEAFSPEATKTFFEGLLPEGEMRELFARFFRVDTAAYVEILRALNEESSGALVFSSSGQNPLDNRSYTAFSREELLLFAEQPQVVALDIGMISRLSIAGAQTKMGLYYKKSVGQLQNDPLDGWYLPKGFAPSNYIIKASNQVFPLQTLNEAFCLTVARLCGLDVASSFLIPASGVEPLLAVERFDRPLPPAPQIVDECPAPQRLHQEDFCQALGLPSFMKYEPTDGNFLSLSANLINKATFNPLGDRLAFFKRIIFDFLVGNCDNHLKNHSLLWEADWSTCSLAPLYDITCTTIYPRLAQEMGVSLCSSRRISDVTANDIGQAAKSLGITDKMGFLELDGLSTRFFEALEQAEKEFLELGYPEVSTLASFIAQDAKGRLSKVQRE